MIKIAGYIILAISCLLFILIPVVPWFDFSTRQIAGITATLLVAGEITFLSQFIYTGEEFF